MRGSRMVAPLQRLPIDRRIAEHFRHVEIHAQMPRLVGVDAGEDLMTQRILDGLEQELAQRAVERDLQAGDHRAQHAQRHVVGEAVQPFHGQADVDVGLGHLVFVVEHAPAPHQRHLGVGMALLLGVEPGVDLAQRDVGRLPGQRREAARTDVLDPHQVDHERLETREEFGVLGDRLAARRLPVEILECPLRLADLVAHGNRVDEHGLLRKR